MSLGPSEISGKVERSVLARLYKLEKEQRMLIKNRSEERMALEAVFDKPTLMTLYDLANDSYFRSLNGVVSSGKEARVYWGVKDDGSSVAVKIFLVSTAEFRRRLPYIEGDPRFTKVKKGIKNIVELWVRKEFANLVAATQAKVRVPRPIVVRRNVLIMEFVGKDGVPCPLLAEGPVEQRDYLRTVLLVRRLYIKAHLVHADLSEFNIFKKGRSLILFDFASAVDVRHPQAEAFLVRDLTNINRFFSKKKMGVEPLPELYEKVTGDELREFPQGVPR